MSQLVPWIIRQENLFLKLLQDTCHKKGKTVVVITHNLAIAPMADRVIEMKNGKISNITINEHPQPVETIEW